MKYDTLEITSYASIAVIAISLFFIGTELTGMATTNDTGDVNVTITDSAGINFTTDLLDFGSGAVTPGQTAVLESNGTGTNLSWSGAKVTGELVLENIGNNNVSIMLQTDKSAQEFIGGSSGATFEAMVSNDSEPLSCVGTNTFTTFAPINTTPQLACGSFNFSDAADELIIDFRINIPDDATGAKTIEIKAIGTY
ncbi:hypothetical protein K8R30_00770 [archaeon]|nr:hypothetical protein [archaeon]